MTLTKVFETFLDRVLAREPLDRGHRDESWTRDPSRAHEEVYRNRRPRLGIDFRVERLDFAAAESMDPRIVRIAPGANNELHKHAHEAVFVILEGEGEVLVGDRRSAVRAGDVAFVPRWAMHQTRNTSASQGLVVLAITDFGLTSSLVGNYDRRTRLRHHGEDTLERGPAQPRKGGPDERPYQTSSWSRQD